MTRFKEELIGTVSSTHLQCGNVLADIADLREQTKQIKYKLKERSS